ncbi:MAG: hypothetical protein ABH863_03555 [Candidatus Micrarchaeota archaeon]
MARKAQFSIDLMMVLAIMLLLFLSLFQYYISKAETGRIIMDKSEAKLISGSLAGRIDAVLLAGNGTNANFILPKTLQNGRDYSIALQPRRLEILLSDFAVSAPLLTSAVHSGDLNSLKGSEITLQNIRGEIYIE